MLGIRRVRLRPDSRRTWSCQAGGSNVWAYRTPWGALWGAWQLENARREASRPVVLSPEMRDVVRRLDAARGRRNA